MKGAETWKCIKQQKVIDRFGNGYSATILQDITNGKCAYRKNKELVGNEETIDNNTERKQLLSYGREKCITEGR